ncbi:MAG: hypothetical protein CM1200mP18_01550 [Gammaproteobacteria bacterium]|nr:MAG: hypothetical protein CM1200mP18_01550 [Gammaproteobacteria bacterium]
MSYRNYNDDQLEAQFVLDSVSQLDVLFEKRLRRKCKFSEEAWKPKIGVRYGTHKDPKARHFCDKSVEQNGCFICLFMGVFWDSLDAKTFSFFAEGSAEMERSLKLLITPCFPDVNFPIIVDSCRKQFTGSMSRVRTEC